MFTETCSQEITELAKALLNVQRQLHPAIKDAKNPFTKSNYATLNSVMESCRDALLTNGIWLCQYPVPVDAQNCLGLMTKLTHAETGQWQSSLAVVPLPKTDPQGMGSAITYARRYALTAMLGMVTEDDDGEAAKLDHKATARTKRSSRAETQAMPASTDETEFANLPKLDGVAYQIVPAQDGRQCVIATGNTHSKREILSGAGFRWNAERKLWWKYADAA